MMLLWSFKAKKGRQLFWTAFCILSLLENLVAADEVTTNSTTTVNTTLRTTTESPESKKPELATAPSTEMTTKNTAAAAAANTTEGLRISSDSENKMNTTSSPTLPVNSTLELIGANSSSTSSTPPNVTIRTPSPTQQPKYISTVPLLSTSEAQQKDMNQIECIDIKHMDATEAITLELNETFSCEDFRKQNELQLSKILCKQNPCNITLAKSEVNKNSILLVEVINKEKSTKDELLKILQEQTAVEELGIISCYLMPPKKPQDYSRKTLIALVTSGLLLAFLGLAGYFLMKQRSWSPMGERLGEDPHYTENGSHGNTVISVTSHEQSGVQDKPNVNGGARENGTGQTASKNGHSTRAHVVADTEL